MSFLVYKWWQEKLQLQNRISAPKRKKKRFWILKPFLKEILKEKSPAPKLRNHPNTIQEPQLQKAIVCIMETAAAARNIDAATIQCVCFVASRGKPACIYAHGTEHGNNHAAITLRDLQPGILQGHRTTHEETHSAEHHGGTKQHQNERTRNRRTHKLPFIAGCSHFTRKNTRFRAPASSPTQVPCNIHAAITLRLIFMWCIVLWCIVSCCIVLFVLWCIVVWCIVVWCSVMWCSVM